MNIFEYALLSIMRRKRKNIFMFIILFGLCFVAFSMLFTATSYKTEMMKTADELPDVVVQKLSGGRQQLIEESRIPEILAIPGVENVIPRVWGYYHFAYLQSNYSVIGVDFFEEQYRKDLKKAAEMIGFEDEKPSMLVSPKIKSFIDQIYRSESFQFQTPGGDYLKVFIKGVFKQSTQMLSSDTVIMDIDSARKVLGIPEGYAADFVIKVPNPEEMQQILLKIQNRFPDLRLITKTDIKSAYTNIFDYKSGIFLSLFLTSLVALFVIIFDRAGGLESDERREIGVLKAVGWKIDDVIRMKLYESFVISFTAFIFALLISILYIYFTGAPIISNIFTGYSYLRPEFKPVFTPDFLTVSIVFFVTVPVYVMATVIPSWKTAAMDASEAVK